MVLRYIRSGKPVFGGSAKAITLGKYIGTSSFGGEADENTVGLNDLRGPDVAREYAVACHHNGTACDGFAVECSESTVAPVIALSDSSGVHVKDDRVFVK